MANSQPVTRYSASSEPGDMADVINQLSAECDALAREKVALKSALEFAHAAISDAIYLDDGLDGETGQRVQRIIVEAMERGTFDGPGDLADFLPKRERAWQEQVAALEAQVADMERVNNDVRYEMKRLEARVKELEQGCDDRDRWNTSRTSYIRKIEAERDRLRALLILAYLQDYGIVGRGAPWLHSITKADVAWAREQLKET